MRLFFKLGVAPKPKQPIELSANSDSDDEPAARWFGFGLDLKTAVAIAGLVIGGIASHVDTANRLTRAESETAQIASSLDHMQTQVDGKLSRVDAESLARQQSSQIDSLIRDRQQIYTMLLQLGRTGRID